MRVWTVVIALGIIGLVAGGALVVLHVHHTIGLAGLGLGALLVVVGLGGRILLRGKGEVEAKQAAPPKVQRGGYRKAAIAVLVVIVIGVGTFYGTSYLAGIQPGGTPSVQTTIHGGQPTSQTIIVPSTLTSSPSATSSAIVTTVRPSTTTVSTIITTTLTPTTSTISTQATSTSQPSQSSSTSFSGTVSTSQSVQSSSTVTSSSVITTTSRPVQSSSTQSTTSPSECATSAPSLDGSGINYNASGTSGVVNLTTNKAPDMVIVFASALTNPPGTNSTPPTVTGIVDGTGSLSFQRRAAYSTVIPDYYGNKYSDEEWFAIASQPLKNDSITVRLSADTSVLTIIAFGVSGASVSSPFDPNPAVPVEASGTNQGTISATVTTSCSNDIIIGAAVMVNLSPGTGPAYTLIETDNGQSNGQDPIAEYAIVSSPQTNLGVVFSDPVQPLTRTWVIIGDAIT